MFKVGELIMRWVEPRVATTNEGEAELSGPSSISYDVNMPDKNAKGTARQRSTSRPRDNSEMLSEVLKLCKETKEDTTKMQTSLDAVVKEVAAVKTQVDKVEERVNKIESDSANLVGRVEKLETARRETDEEIEARLEKKILDKLRAQYPQLADPKVSTSTRGTRPPIPGPSMGGKVGNKVHEAFQDLLRAAEARKNSFLVGVIEQYTESGAQLRPTLRYDQVVRRFFRGLRHEMGALGYAQSTGMPLVKVSVHPDDVHEAKLRVRDRWRETRDFGWWVGQENPPDLRQMQANAFRFIMASKKSCGELRRYYLEADEGFIRYARVPFLPVYLVPTNKAKWSALGKVLLSMVQSIRDRDWVDRFRGVRELHPALIAEWNAILKRGGDGEEYEEDASEDDDRVPATRAAGKLNYLGRVNRASARDVPLGPGGPLRTPLPLRSLSLPKSYAQVVGNASMAPLSSDTPATTDGASATAAVGADSITGADSFASMDGDERQGVDDHADDDSDNGDVAMNWVFSDCTLFCVEICVYQYKLRLFLSFKNFLAT